MTKAAFDKIADGLREVLMSITDKPHSSPTSDCDLIAGDLASTLWILGKPPARARQAISTALMDAYRRGVDDEYHWWRDQIEADGPSESPIEG